MPPLPQSVGKESSNTSASRSRSPLKFFLLVFVLSIPFWLIGAVTRLQLLQALPVSSLMVFCPSWSSHLWPQSSQSYGDHER